MADTALFTTAEARAFDKGQLADGEDYQDATITAAEVEIREFFSRTCRCDFFPTTHTDEYHSGDGTSRIALTWPMVTSVTAVSTRADTTWTALSAGELADIYVDPDNDDEIVWESGWWTRGVRNIKVTYVAGHTAVPKLVKDAALRIAVSTLPTSALSMAANTFDENGMAISFNLGDGYNDNWHPIPEVRRAIRLYSRRLIGAA